MYKRFKPIGGMFQGVRGSTSVGGAPKYAGKLLKLNSDGVMDDSCFPADIQAVAQGVVGLEMRVDVIEETSLPELSSRLNSLNEELNGENGEIAARIEADRLLKVEIDANKSASDEAEAALASRVTVIEEDSVSVHANIAANSSEIGSNTDRIRNLEAFESSTEATVQTLAGRITALEERVASVEARQTEMQSQLNGISTDIGNWGVTLSNLTIDMRNMSGDFDAHKQENEGSFSAINSRMEELSAKIEEIYDRIVNCESGQGG